MKAILEFTLPEEKQEFEMATNGNKYHSILWDFDQHLRAIVKYGDDKYTMDELTLAEQLREKLHELMNDNRVQFE